MKWFKHLTASGTDPDIGAIVDKFGFKGYYLFFRTLEIMSTELSVENPAENSFNFHWFLDQFSRKIDRKTLLNFFDFTSKIGRIYYTLNGKTITIKCPKLKDLTDEYTDKMMKQKSGVNRDSIGSKSGVNPAHRRKKKEIRSKNVSKDTYIYTADFEEFWKEYPLKKEKQDAFSKWKKLKQSQKEEVLKSIKNYIADCQYYNRFFKHPKTYLNPEKERWKDYLEPFVPPKTKTSSDLDAWARDEIKSKREQCVR